MKIYMYQTIQLIAQTIGVDEAQTIIDNSVGKQLKDESYYFILNETEED